MEPKKSKRPALATLAGGAILVSVTVIGAAYFLRDDSTPVTRAPSSRAAATLHEILVRCDEEPTEDTVDGRTRIRCATKVHPAFMIEIISEGDDLVSAKMLTPMRGTMNQLLDRMLVGLRMFGAVAGLQADAFLPKEYLDAIGTSKTSLVFQGRAYTTEPIANVGLIFAVTPADAASASEQ